MNFVSKFFLLLSWNVRGLGDLDKCNIVRDALKQATPSIICLQETKLCECSRFKIQSRILFACEHAVILCLL
jgi:exonuclease III